MKIVVSVHELSTETQAVIDNMQRSKAPVLVGDPNRPMAVLLSLEEYDHLLRMSQKATAPAAEAAERVPAPAPVPDEAAQPVQPAPAPPAAQSAPADVVPAPQQSDIAQRTAATIQADRSAPAEPKLVSQRNSTMQPDPTLTAKRAPSLRGPRLTRPLPKPPGPLQTPRPRLMLNPSAIPGGWQTIALVVGMLILAGIGLALIVSAFNG